jgi:nitrogen fixation/metabolism regulation signal transduction histidine kinase
VITQQAQYSAQNAENSITIHQVQFAHCAVKLLMVVFTVMTALIVHYVKVVPILKYHHKNVNLAQIF